MLESCGCEIDVSAENQNLRDNYMANKYEVIDESTWERAMHCMVFRNSIEPAFCVTFEADVTEFKKKVKEEGAANDLLSRIAADPLFHTTEETLQNVLQPRLYVGRAPQQTEEFLAEVVRPVLDANRDVLGMTAEVNV